MTRADAERTPRVRVHAPAKVNLALRVGPVRPDGFHDLETLFQGIDLCDEIEVERGGDGAVLEVEGADLGPIEQNLVLRAARAYLTAAGERAAGVRIRLRKTIPAAAGLGGGSSDAAATLRALDRLFGGAVARPDLARIAEGMGSDVPFFLSPTPLALGRGRGEKLEPIEPLPALPGIVLMPEVGVSTAEAYRALDRARAGKPSRLRDPLRRPATWAEAATDGGNDFEEVIGSALPEVADALARLGRTEPLIAGLSGSGAACFGLYADEERAGKAGRALAGSIRGRLFAIRTLTRWPEPIGP